MAEYIEREEALSAQNKSMNLAEMRERLERIHAADVRPVVLCRDCRHWDTDWTPNHAMANEHFCPIIGLTTREDWFCADGEKREES